MDLDISRYNPMMMSPINFMCGQLHRLLKHYYDAVDDVILAEDKFVELAEDGTAIQQVLLGMSEHNFLLARREVVYWTWPMLISNNEDDDPELNNIYLRWVVPLKTISIAVDCDTYRMIIYLDNGQRRKFEMCTAPVDLDMDSRWFEWMSRIPHIKDYGTKYIYVADELNPMTETLKKKWQIARFFTKTKHKKRQIREKQIKAMQLKEIKAKQTIEIKERQLEEKEIKKMEAKERKNKSRTKK